MAFQEVHLSDFATWQICISKFYVNSVETQTHRLNKSSSTLKQVMQEVSV